MLEATKDIQATNYEYISHTPNTTTTGKITYEMKVKQTNGSSDIYTIEITPHEAADLCNNLTCGISNGTLYCQLSKMMYNERTNTDGTQHKYFTKVVTNEEDEWIVTK